MKRSTFAGVVSLLKELPETKQYPDKWWSISKRYIDKLLDRNEIDLAYFLAKTHGNTDNAGDFAEADNRAGHGELYYPR